MKDYYLYQHRSAPSSSRRWICLAARASVLTKEERCPHSEATRAYVTTCGREGDENRDGVPADLL